MWYVPDSWLQLVWQGGCSFPSVQHRGVSHAHPAGQGAQVCTAPGEGRVTAQGQEWLLLLLEGWRAALWPQTPVLLSQLPPGVLEEGQLSGGLTVLAGFGFELAWSFISDHSGFLVWGLAVNYY